jgi:hypothetical protein
MRKIVNQFVITGFLLIATADISAQQPADSSSTSYAAGLYLRSLPEKGLYNGRQYIDYNSFLYNAHAHFRSKALFYGEVFYDGILYEKVPMHYDIIRDVLAVSDLTDKYLIELQIDKIGWFNIDHTRFIYLEPDGEKKGIPPGFYHPLYEGVSAVYRQDKKIVTEKLESQVVRIVSETHSYYIRRGNEYFSANSKAAVLRIFSDKKGDIRQYIRKNKIDVNKGGDEALVSIASHYDQLKSKDR